MDLQTSASPALLKVPVLSNSVNLGISPLEHRLVEGRHLSKAQSQPSTLENSQDFLPSEFCAHCVSMKTLAWEPQHPRKARCGHLVM